MSLNPEYPLGAGPPAHTAPAGQTATLPANAYQYLLAMSDALAPVG